MHTKGFTIFFRLLIINGLFLSISCKTRNNIDKENLIRSLGTKQIVQNHYQHQLDFETLNGKIKIDYSDGEKSQGIGLTLRMKKDEVIWISALLGVVKAKITPEKVSFYNRLQNEYFDGDFSYLSSLLGTSLDFEKVQNLLLGQALFDLKEETYNASVSNENYELKPKNPGTLFKTLFHIEPKNFKMASQQLSQPLRKRLLDINYKNYQKINKWILPNEIAIVAIENDKRNTIGIEYRNIEFDKPLRFPYKIPDGYEEIVLTKNDF